MVFVTIEAPEIEANILLDIGSFDDLKDSVLGVPIVHSRIGAIENDVNNRNYFTTLSLPESETNLE